MLSLYSQPNQKPDHFDKAFNDEILALEVKCKNHEWGCKWESDYQYFQVSDKYAGQITYDLFYCQTFAWWKTKMPK